MKKSDFNRTGHKVSYQENFRLRPRRLSVRLCREQERLAGHFMTPEAPRKANQA